MMSEPTITAIDALRELITRKFILAYPVPRLLPCGNTDRRDCALRSSWQVHLPDGKRARLMIAPDLSDLQRRHTAFAEDCPQLIPPLFFYHHLDEGEALAEVFFDGDPLEFSPGKSAMQINQSAFGQLWSQLSATTKPSKESDRSAEWRAWTASVESLELWQPQEKKILNEIIWPRLYPLLCAKPASKRWTNGDFTSANILINKTGQPQLIDLEFAVETHFFAEDSIRFQVLSPGAAQWRETLFPFLPTLGPAWHLFFWLRQLLLESRNNTTAYLARTLSAKLGVIRRLGENITGVIFETWSVESLPIYHTIESAYWDQSAETALRISGWCHVAIDAPLDSVVITQNDDWLAECGLTGRPDVQAHFAGATSALCTGFNLTFPAPVADTPLVISALLADDRLLPFCTIKKSDLPGRGPWKENYTRWSARYDPDPALGFDDSTGPAFSILLPIFNSPPEFLRACIQSVLRQHYSRWELCIVDDGSTAGGGSTLLQEFANDSRVRLIKKAVNGGISRATNVALAAATGEYIVLLDHDDIIRPHALSEFARHLKQAPALDVIYSDEDKITAEGIRVEPFLKPDFSPEYLLGVMYIGHALCVRTSLARLVGGFQPIYDGVQDYEFFLRLTERTRSIAHIPRVLYHWRQSPGSSALHGNVKGNMDEKQVASVQAHLRRVGRTETAFPHNGHRVQLHSSNLHAVEIIQTAPNNDLFDSLRASFKKSKAEILVFTTTQLRAIDEHWVRELSNMAARPDSGLVAPLLLSSDGLVWESGWTIGPCGTQPLMRGFDPANDGYNGTLPCTREVAAVSFLCFALRRELAQTSLSLSTSVVCNWLEFSLQLRSRGLFHRVCSTARVQLLAHPPVTMESNSAVYSSDPFFNPHFDPARADYSLARPPSHLPDL